MYFNSLWTTFCLIRTFVAVATQHCRLDCQPHPVIHWWVWVQVVLAPFNASSGIMLHLFKRLKHVGMRISIEWSWNHPNSSFREFIYLLRLANVWRTRLRTVIKNYISLYYIIVTKLRSHFSFWIGFAETIWGIDLEASSLFPAAQFSIVNFPCLLLVADGQWYTRSLQTERNI